MLICPNCGKSYKRIYWYERHCTEKHGDNIYPIELEIIEKDKLDKIYDEIFELKELIKTLKTSGPSSNEISEIKNMIRSIRVGTGTGPITHDIDIKSLKKPGQGPISIRPPSPMDACIGDLKEVFSQGLNILENMEKAKIMVEGEVKQKTEEELRKLEEEAILRAQERAQS